MSLWKIAMSEIRDPAQLRYVRDSQWPPTEPPSGLIFVSSVTISISVASYALGFSLAATWREVINALRRRVRQMR
jgi:hypothetical protein